ncbi:MAG: hypothetical protein EOO40_00295 [Deltaproteobacteria bacterium]|nr:MAG: hypothetical protein EOO40_00295 [Deltaproteobacteria bacterium]
MALVKPLFFNTQEGIEQELDPLVDAFAVAQITLNGLGGVGINANGQQLTGLPTPVGASDATNKGYVDSVVQGLNLKAAVIAVATGNITLSGTQSIDGVSVKANDRVLVTQQSDAKMNGIWVVQSGNWIRPLDYNAGSPAAASYTFVEEGTLNQDSGWVCVTDPGADKVDANPTMWTQFSGAGQIIPGSGISKDGNTLSVALAPNAGLQFTSGKLNTYLTGTGGLTSDANGMRLLYKNAGSTNQTLTSDINGIAVLGLPSLFTVNGSATTANVSASALNLLTSGPAGIADNLHTHYTVQTAQSVTDFHTTGTALAAGDPVAWSSTASTLARGDAGIDAQARIIGIAVASAAANSKATICKRGVIKGILSGATIGAPVFLNLGGGLTQTVPTGTSGLRVIRLGFAVTATDLDLVIHDLGKRS